MEENNKIPNWKNVVIVIMLALLIFCMFKLFDLSDDISALESRIANYQSQLSRLSSDINSIYVNVDEQLKKQASLVSSVDYTLGGLDTEAHRVSMTLKVVPKAVTDNTELSVRIGDTTADFVRNGDEFIAVIPVGLFIGYGQYPMLSIKTAGETKTEILNSVEISNLHIQCLPNVSANISPFYDFSNGKLKINSYLHLSVYSENSVTVTKTEIITELNGQEIERQDITSTVKNASYYGVFTKTYSANEGDELVIYIVAEDSLGYIHKARALYWMQKDGAIYEEAITKVEDIYDKNGNLLTK